MLYIYIYINKSQLQTFHFRVNFHKGQHQSKPDSLNSRQVNRFTVNSVAVTVYSSEFGGVQGKV